VGLHKGCDDRGSSCASETPVDDPDELRREVGRAFGISSRPLAGLQVDEISSLVGILVLLPLIVTGEGTR
jgi:hypothetical protein